MVSEKAGRGGGGGGGGGGGEDVLSPLLVAARRPLSSSPKTLANVFIAIVGAGVLGLPYTFKRTGWAASLLMLASVAALSHYCMMLLVLTRRRLLSPSSSFGDLGFAVCGPLGRLSVDLLILLSQSGFCIGYLIFIATTASDLLLLPASSRALYVSACFPFQLALNSLPTLTHLAPLSIFADLVDLAAMAVVMARDASIISRSPPRVEAFSGGASTLLYCVGVAVYAFEGVGMVLPIESEMKDRDKFGKVLGLAMGSISLMYGSFGLMGYLAFGEETKDIITANLGPGPISALVQLGLCINLFFTFPLMMHPVYEILERRFRGGAYCLWLRWAAVAAVSLVALLVPNFGDFLSLVGSSVCCGLGFVLPALFHLLVFKDDMGWGGWSIDVGIVALGVILGVAGTLSTLAEMFALKVEVYR